MSWAKLLADKRVTPLPSSKAELDQLRSIVTRSLQDATTAGLSADARFVMAYDAACTLSLLVVRAAGYPPVGGCALQHVSRLGGGRSGIRQTIRLLRQLPDKTQPVRI